MCIHSIWFGHGKTLHYIDVIMSITNARSLDWFKRLFRRRWNKTSKLRVAEGNPPVTGRFPSQRTINAYDDVIMVKYIHENALFHFCWMISYIYSPSHQQMGNGYNPLASGRYSCDLKLVTVSIGSSKGLVWLYTTPNSRQAITWKMMI